MADPSLGDERLLRGINLWALVAFVLNLTVGAGILGLPSKLESLVADYSVPVMVACGLLMMLIALCFAEIGSRFDRTGGPQLYATVAFGPGVGFTVGWLLWISRLGTCAAVSNLLVDYGTVLLPAASRALVRAGIISTIVIAYAAINIRGIRQTAAVSTAFTLCKVIPLAVFAITGLFFIHPERVHFGPLPSAADFSTAILLAAFAYFGFDGATVLAGEVRDARRAVPFATVVSVLVVTLLYSLIQLVCVGTLPNLAASERPLADAATVMVGAWASALVALTGVVACAGVFGASMTPATRLIYAMADRRQLPMVLARVHGLYRTPVPAILLTAAATWVLAVSGSFIYLVKITLIARVSVYAVTCLTLPVLRRRVDASEAGFKVVGGPAIAVGCTLVSVLFLAGSSMRELFDVTLAVVMGLTLFALTRARGRVQGDLR